jgi:hypothetical protein
MNRMTRLERTALHEACHALYGQQCGFEIAGIRVSPGNGRTSVCLPFALSELPAYYRAAPAQTFHQLLDVITTLLVPSVAMNEPPHGCDATELWSWKSVWEKCRYAHGGAPWVDVQRLASGRAQEWLRAPGRLEQLAVLADELAARRMVYGAPWRALVAHHTPRPTPTVRQATPVRPARQQRTTASTINDEDVLCLVRSWRNFGVGCLPLVGSW